MFGSTFPGLALIGLSMLTIAATPAGAAERDSSLVFILDGSGSMWGRIGGNEPKIEAAKSVTRDLLKDVPDTVEIGFVSYGHRRKGDCTDIETIADLGARPGEVAAAVDKITPRGKTPITDALRHGATLFQGKDRPSTMVLVSDGIETCKGDPCALARELKKGGIDLVIHTVGFGVGDKAARQLQCIAEAGGGNYYDAKSGAALRTALFAVRKAVVENKPARKPKPVKVETKPKPKSKTIRIAGPGTIKLKPASWVKMPPYAWRAADPETEDKPISVRRRAEMKVKPGEYQIVWRQTEHGTRDVPLTDVAAVEAGKTVEVPIDTGLEIVVPQGTKPPYLWSLTRPGEDKAIVWFKGRLGPQVVPAGTYRLGWRQVEHGAPRLDFGPVTVEAGKLNRRVLDSGMQVVRADWVPPKPYALALTTAEGKKVGSWRIWNAPLFVPPGTYDVVYRQSEHGHSGAPWGRITVPEHGYAKLTINSGVKFKPQPDSKPPYRVIFVPLDGGDEITWKGKWRGKWEPVPVPPGRYRLDWWEAEHGTKRMTLLEEFEIEPGTLVELQM